MVAEPTIDLDAPLIAPIDVPTSTNGASDTPAEDAPVATTDAPAVDAPEDAEVDYKAKLEEAEAQILKLTNDHKAEKEGRKRTADRDAVLADLQSEMASLKTETIASREAQKVLITALNSGETDGVADKLDAIDQNSTSTQAMARIKVQVDALKNTLMNDIGVAGDDRFADTITEWNRVSADANLQAPEKLVELTSVVAQATIKKMGYERATHEKELEEAKDAASTVRKQTLEDSDLLGTDTGGRSGAVTSAPTTLVQRYNNGDRLSKGDQDKVNEYLDGLDDTPGSAGIA